MLILDNALEFIESLNLYFSKNNPKEIEWLTIGAEIEMLARDLICEDEFDDAELLSQWIVNGGGQKNKAISILSKMIGYRPKRPLYYVSQGSIRYLPDRTRDTIRYLGDYIDVIVKCIAKENAPKPFFKPRSLGTNLYHLKGKLPDNLHALLKRYDDNIYCPAKHDFSTGERNHRFTLKETVYVVFITMSLAKELTSLSPLAREYISDTNPNIWDMTF
jgi:hypothetical protein